MKFLEKIFHNCNFIFIEDISIFEESNPYAIMGQKEVCKAHQCKNCGKIQVRSFGINNNGWQNIKGFITTEKKYISQKYSVAKV